ncbi:MAG: fibronectin type III domain-containing protein [Acidobacteria bacterium]|nr:fibronectin type III domain-containing protein [Acidobacteriota bacterium]
MTMRLIGFSLAFCLVSIQAAVAQTWAAGLRMTTVDWATIGSTVYRSASRLTIAWSPPTETVHQYVLTLRDGVTGREGSVALGGTSVTIGGLKSSTPYTATIKACLDAGCERSLEADAAASAQTPAEYWRVQGTGNSYTTATKIVSDGNTYPFAVPYGSWAGAALSGKVQLYYNPTGSSEKGIKIAEMAGGTSDSVASLSSYRPVSGYGLVRVCQQMPGQPFSCPGSSLAAVVTTTQPVALDASMGGGIRLFFEATGTDQRSRIMYLDSRDGFVGRDFNAGDKTICSTLSDFSASGGCVPTVAIGVSGDADGMGTPGLRDARQFKIGYPTRTDWRWSGAPGTFMVFTAEFEPPCSSETFFNQSYASWDGFRWTVQTGADGCPKYMAQVQAPMPVQVENVRYKMYFSHNTLARGGTSNPLTDPKPIKVMYADGGATGDATVVDFEDWEDVAQARDVNFLWPDGTPMDLPNESALDDFIMFMPTGAPNLQIMYANMHVPGGNSIPFIGMAALINP